MQHPSTPSSSRSARAPMTPPTHATYGPNTPGAPFMGSRGLPPSPYTPNSARMPLPATPFLSSVPLPAQVNNPYGLLTPPASPARPRGQLGLTEILTPQSAAAVLFDMRYPLEQIQFGYYGSQLDAHATSPPTDRLQISIFFNTILIDVTNPAGVTVKDVFDKLFRELNKPAQGQAVKRIDLLAPCFRFGGISYNGSCFSLIVRA